MRTASATSQLMAITVAVCFIFVFAVYGGQQPSSAEIVGRWHTLETTKGGIGQIWELRSNGTADWSIGADVTMPWRIDHNQLIVPPATTDGSEQKYTLKWLGDNKVRWESAEGVAELQRVGSRSDSGKPIIGEWIENREMGGHHVEARYFFYPSGQALLLIPMTTEHGRYWISGSVLRIERDGETRQFKLKIGNDLLTVSALDDGQTFHLARY